MILGDLPSRAEPRPSARWGERGGRGLQAEACGSGAHFIPTRPLVPRMPFFEAEDAPPALTTAFPPPHSYPDYPVISNVGCR